MTPHPRRRLQRRPIYVESRIRAPIEAPWDATQRPEQHQRWDVRFGSINYLASREGEPQRFTYATKVGPGITIAGVGESLGDRDRADGTRWSGLRFWADDRRSIIQTGAGYWRYVPTADGVRFLTKYDYQPRWGPLRRSRRSLVLPFRIRLGHCMELRPVAPVARGRDPSRALS